MGRSRGGQGVRTPSLKNHKNIGLFSNTGPDSLKFTKLTSQHSIMLGVVMGGTMAQIFFKPEKNLEFFRLKICAIDANPGKLE